MKRWLLGIGLLLANLANAQAQVITQWTFEGNSSVSSTGSAASLIGGTTATFASGNGSASGWNTSTYAAQSTEGGLRGVQFLASTAGFQNIAVSFDHRASGTASRWAQLDYTLNGGTSWTTGFWNNGGGLSPHDTFYNFNVDLSSVAGANNNADFGVRIVSIFSPQAFDQNASLADFAANSAYMRANAQASYTAGGGVGTGDYGGGGTWRFDNVTITAVPEPSSIALLSLVGLGGVAVRRFRKGRLGW